MTVEELIRLLSHHQPTDRVFIRTDVGYEPISYPDRVTALFRHDDPGLGYRSRNEAPANALLKDEEIVVL